uniref:Tyr recombinase domain-containing protein n=1 Tax=Xenopus tropicalis TaxID=8364 RepID=A0A803JHX3_XENTR
MENSQATLQENQTITPDNGFPELVVSAITPVSRTVVCGTNVAGDNHRCKSLGVGSDIQKSDSAGSLVGSRNQNADKHTGNQSNIQCPTALGETITRPRHSNSVRQRHSSGIYQSTRGDEKSHSLKRSKENPELGGESCVSDISSTHTRSSKLGSRFPKSPPVGFNRVGTKLRSLRVHSDRLGSTRNRPHGIAPQPEDREIHGKDKRSISDSSRRSDSKMGSNIGIRISSHSYAASYTQENKAGKRYIYRNSSLLAEKVMVLGPEGNVNRTTFETTQSGRPSTSRSNCALQTRDVLFDGMAVEKSILMRKGFSPEVAQTMIRARKNVSSKSYHRIWKLFINWCSSRQMDYEKADIPVVLQFLQEGLDKGLGLSSLKVQVSSLSVLLQSRLALQEDVRVFLQGVAHVVPPIRSPVPPWDLNTVLVALTNPPFEPISIIEMQWLTWKTVFLVAISSARRVSEIGALSCNSPYLIFHTEKAILRTRPSFLPKVVSPFHLNEEIVIPSFCSTPKNAKEEKLHNIDVVRALHTYVERTASFRKSDALFVIPSGSRKGFPASKATIARWIREAIRRAYISLQKPPPFRIKAHSTRAMGASWACRNMASAEQLCRAATWASVHTFTKHYRFDTFASAEAAFGRKVLQSVVL